MRKFTKYPSNYVKANLNYDEEPYGFSEGAFDKYDAEDWAYYIAEKEQFDEDMFYDFLHDINNLRANEWIENDWLENLTEQELTAFKKFIHYNEDDEE